MEIIYHYNDDDIEKIEKIEYKVNLDVDGYFVCPICNKAKLKFEDWHYNAVITLPRAKCPKCESEFFNM